MFKGREVSCHIDHTTNYEDRYEVDPALKKRIKPRMSADKKLYLLSTFFLLATLALSAYFLVMEERKNDYLYGGAGYAQQ